jgi:REP element-mobilizing transposase RayT
VPVKRKIKEPDGVFFITITCFQWLSLIKLTNSYDLVYKWFDHLKSWGHYINGYVIMPNHIHALLAFRNTGKLINTIIGNGKRFIAYEIVNRLEKRQEHKLLHELNLAVESTDRERHKKHEIWEDSFDWKECRTHKYISQKLDYMHQNPCRGKWNLAVSPAGYEHSSARFYTCGEHAAYPVTSYLELDDIDLTILVKI